MGFDQAVFRSEGMKNAKIIIPFILLALFGILAGVYILTGDPSYGLLGTVLGLLGFGTITSGGNSATRQKDSTPPVSDSGRARSMGADAKRQAAEVAGSASRFDKLVSDSRKRSEELEIRGAEIRAESGGFAEAIRKGVKSADS